jgi:hypothetical protein
MKLIFSIVSALLVAVLLAPDFASAKTPQHNSATRHAHPHHSGARSKAVPGVRRDAHGNIKRSTRAKDDFQKSHPCPATGKTAGSCPGYIIDHVKPLKRGGDDSPGNMQWQTKKAAKLKDKTE